MDNKDELYHYGVLGMKWGKHKAQGLKPTTDGSSLRKYKQAIANRKAAKDVKKMKYAQYSTMFDQVAKHPFGIGGSKEQDARFEKSRKEAHDAITKYKAAKRAEKAAKKMAKAEAKEVKKLYRAEYLKGKSFIGRLNAKIDGSDKIYADFAYGLTDGKYVKGDVLFDGRKKTAKKVADKVNNPKKQPWDEKSRRKQPWDEKPSRQRGNI